MVERLNQISLNNFIELSCGNYDCLLSAGENVSEEELKKKASKFVADYRNIVNPSEMEALILDKEDMIKEHAKLLSLRICQTLISLNYLDDVREILVLLGVDVRKMDSEQLIAKVEYMLNSIIFEQKRNEEMNREEGLGNNSSPEQIRSSFDTEIAFLMTYFKMNIDPCTINAAVYANIVHQAYMEISIKRTRT